MTNSRKDIVQNEGEKSLLDFPDEILLNIPAQGSDNVSMEVMRLFSRTCHTLHNLFQPEIDKQDTKILCQHVVYGEMKEAEKLLAMNPRLLLAKALVTDEAGRKILGTVFQIALGAKDVSPFPDEFNEMAEMIASYFKKLPDGEKEKQKQYAEQFPEGFEALEKERQARDSEALNTVFAAIKDKTLAEAEVAVTIFQDYLKTQTQQVIKNGYHFNEVLFEQALTLYNNNFDDCGGYFSDKNNLAAVKVLGGIQRYFTANLAQSACDGFGKVVDDEKALSRSKLLADDVTSFFSTKLGIDHFVFSYYDGDLARDRARRSMSLGCRPARPTIFKSYVEQKQQSWINYSSSLGIEQATVCDFLMSK